MNWLRLVLVFGFIQHAYPANAVLVVGATLPLSGPLMEQGQLVRDGINVALQEAVLADPSLKPLLRFEVLDDAGDPKLAAQNAKKLVSQFNAQVLVGCVGERLCATVEQVARQSEVPLLGLVNANDEICRPGSSAYCLHNAYAEEASAIARQLVAQGMKRIHLLVSAELTPYQAKVIGNLEGVGLAVNAHKFDAIRANVPSFLAASGRADQAVLMLLNNSDAVEAIKLLRQSHSGGLVGAFSSIEPHRWLQQTQGISTGVIMANTMPNPDLDRTRLVKRYQSALTDHSQFNLPYTHAQLEMYVAGRLLANYARQGYVSKQAIAQALQKNKLQVDEVTVSFKGQMRTLELPINLNIVSRSGVLIQ